MRARALRQTENWLLEHQDADGSWGGIEPCYLLSPMALKAHGYRNDHPVLKKAIEASRELIWGSATTPCTAVRVAQLGHRTGGEALLDAGVPGDHPAMSGPRMAD